MVNVEIEISGDVKTLGEFSSLLMKFNKVGLYIEIL